MTLAPLLTASIAIQIHVIAAILSVVVGPFTLWRRRRDHWHKRLGYIWVSAMALTALSSFAIVDMALIGPFSPIHLLSILVLFSLWQAIRAVRRGAIETHRITMQQTYFWALGIAGIFTFLPGRRMNNVFFSDAPVLGFLTVAVLVSLGLLWSVRRNARLSMV